MAKLSPQIELIAHRGMPRHRIENTLPGFRLALERGAQGIELDVHVTQDGVVVVHHDPTVGARPIATNSWQDLEELQLGGDFRLPRLEDVFDDVADQATVYVELKGAKIEKAVLEVARAHGRRFALHSFDHDAIARVAKLAPKVRRGILLDEKTKKPVDAMLAAVQRTGATDVWPHRSLIDEKLAKAAHGAKARVIAWTVNSVKEAQKLVDVGVDAICTDDVGLFAKPPKPV